MHNQDQDIKDTKLEENLSGDQPSVPAGQLAEPVAFEPDETPPRKPEPEDEFSPQPIDEDDELRRVGHAHHPDAAQADIAASDPSDEELEPDDIEPLEPEEYETTFDTVIEAVLFASDEPLSSKRLVDIAEAGSVKQIVQCVKGLNKKYKQGGFSFRIEKIAGGYQMMTLPAFNPWLGKLLKVRTDNKLSPAALETLAVVAYKQPVIRADVEAIRGVASGEVIRNLMYKGLVKIVGRAEILGRPMLYGTTKKFLDVFGLNTLKDLPKVDELKNPERG